MSSLKTDKLGLNKWVPTDYVNMGEFNDNFQKIDDAHKDVTTQLADIGDYSLVVDNAKIDGFNIQRENADNNILRVGTFNILADNYLFGDKSLYLQALGLDIVALQEIPPQTDDFDKFINSLTPYTKRGLYTRYVNNAILSRFKIVDDNDFLFDLSPTMEMDRSFTRITVNIFGKTVSVYCTHLSWETSLDRKNQMDRLLDLAMKDVNRYVVICGDFNISTISEFNSFTENGFKLVNNGNYITHPSDNKFYDNIIVSSNINIVNSRMVDTNNLSDHRIIYADLELV